MTWSYVKFSLYAEGNTHKRIKNNLFHQMYASSHWKTVLRKWMSKLHIGRKYFLSRLSKELKFNDEKSNSPTKNEPMILRKIYKWSINTGKSVQNH